MNVCLKRARSKMHERKKHNIYIRSPDGRYPPLKSFKPFKQWQ